MHSKSRSNRKTLWNSISLIGLALASGALWAHCDTVSGPVAVDAREALEEGDFQEVAIWVGTEQTEELRAAFEQSLPVYRMGDAAKVLAERHFTETAVRLHRQAEGLPYTGLRPAQPLPPDIATAERALQTGNLGLVTDLLGRELQEDLAELFRHVRDAQEKRNDSLAAGREWADAYVRYVVFVHGVYQTIQQGPKHGVGD